MALSPGAWLNHYEILGHIGSGGMGEVYRARDNKLQREVALKVLPQQFARDPERVARFRREAQLLAQLNHPNIAAIYSVEQTGDTHFLVMELAPGETLKDRIQKSGVRGQNKSGIPIEEALDIAKQIAAGLACAHEKPIVHRDLKPANVKVTPEGVVKILDFGLARAFAPDTGSGGNEDWANSPTLTGMTEPGVILGTAAYMSPEQARGKTVDKRSDIWAFGCVLYEMLTGKHAYDGEDVTDILASVVKSEPDWQALPEATPPKVRDLLRRCLQKDKDRRSRDASEIQLQIQEALESPAPEETKVAKAPPPPALWRRAMPFGLTGLIAVVLAGLAGWNLKPAPPPQPVTRLVVPLPPNEQLTGIAAPMVALSPDGTHVAYVASSGISAPQLYVRAMDSLETRPLAGTENARGPFFSPDGQWIGFFADAKLKKVPVSGGAVLSLSEAVAARDDFRGGTWGPNETIVFTSDTISGLSQVSAAGGQSQALTKLNQGESSHRWPQFLPDGKTILFTVGLTAGGFSYDDAHIAVQRLDTGERKVLIRGGTYGRYVPTGHLVYYRAGTMMAVPFDSERLEVRGTPAPVIEGVMASAGGFGGNTGAAQFSVSSQGSLAYIQGSAVRPEVTAVWVDRKGAAQPLGTPPRRYLHPHLSPDGRQLSVTISGGSNNDDIWVYDLPRGTLTRLTFGGGLNHGAFWTPDGKRIVFRSARPDGDNLFWKAADGTGAEEQLTKRKEVSSLSSVSPDGKLAFYSGDNPTTRRDIWVASLEGERKESVFLQTPFDELVPRISPDGRWLAYLSDESGRVELYVRSFPGPGGKWQISTEGATEPLWARNGRELFYRVGKKVMAVDITTQPTFQASTPRLLFEGDYTTHPVPPEPNYDISADGQRFLMFKAQEEAAAPTQIHVVQNWFEELKQRVPTGR